MTDEDLLMCGIRPENMPYDEFRIKRALMKKEIKQYLKGRYFHKSKEFVEYEKGKYTVITKTYINPDKNAKRKKA